MRTVIIVLLIVFGTTVHAQESQVRYRIKYAAKKRGTIRGRMPWNNESLVKGLPTVESKGKIN